MDEATRVLFVLTGPTGGATLSMLSLAEELPRDRFRPYAVLPPSDNRAAVAAVAARFEGLREIPMSWWQLRSRAAAWQRPLMWASATARTWWHMRTLLALRSAIRDWNIGLVHTATSQVIDGAVAAKFARLPHVWHVRERIGSDGAYRFALPDSLLFRTFDTFSSAIVANSSYTAEPFRRGRIDSVTVIPNGIDATRFRQGSGTELRERLGIASSDVLVAMVGGLSAAVKRHDLFIEMAALLGGRPSVRFVVFGDVPSTAYSARMQSAVLSRGLSERFFWAGHQDDVPAMMDAVDILVHPFGGEGFGRVVLEAMAAGKPVVAVGGGGVLDIVENGRTGVLVDASAESLAREVSALAADPGRRQRLGHAARDRAIEMFASRDVTARLMSVYESVMNKS